ncbi:MAG: hypothetical protein ONB44_09405 [candidate division KSB1 bacterium]|nr:hypothetical protein [candidate division KSB1 bacterium]
MRFKFCRRKYHGRQRQRAPTFEFQVETRLLISLDLFALKNLRDMVKSLGHYKFYRKAL